MRALLALSTIAVSLLAGSPARSSDWTEARDRAHKCFDGYDQRAEYAVITSKLPPGKPTVAQLADETIPTEVEAGLISALATHKVGCRDMMLAAMRQHHPYLVPSVELRYFQVDVVYVQLIKRRIAYGNANRLIEQSYLEFAEREAQYDRARSEAQKRALADSMSALARQARSAPPPAGSGRMTCRWVGPTLYCDPY